MVPGETQCEGTSVLLTKEGLCVGLDRGRSLPPALGQGVLCQSWLCFSFIPGRINANPVLFCWPQGTSLALGTSLKRERAGSPMPRVGWED